MCLRRTVHVCVTSDHDDFFLFSLHTLAKHIENLMNRMTLRLRALRHQSKSFSQSCHRPFIGNIFGSKQMKQREEIIKNQDKFESDQESKIVILNKKNSPDAEKFNPETDMEGFKIVQWKKSDTKPKDIESKFSTEKLKDIIIETYKELGGSSALQSLQEMALDDLSFRFRFAKTLQSNLGFELSDYVWSKSHNLETVHDELSQAVSRRWKSERNPNAIVLRPEDFTAKNIYLNQELPKKKQEALYGKLLEKARKSAFQ